MNSSFGRSSLINEKFIELCDEFINKSFFANRQNCEEIKKEWTYFKILLNNKMLEKQQVSDYFSILKEKILLQKPQNLSSSYKFKTETEFTNKPALITNTDPPKKKSTENLEFLTHKAFSDNKNALNPHITNVPNMNFPNPFLKSSNYAEDIYEFLRKHNGEINRLANLDTKSSFILEGVDLVDEITQKYH